MPNPTQQSHTGRFDLVAGVIALAIAVGLFVHAGRTAGEATRQFGRNIDSGAYEATAAVFEHLLTR